MSMSNNDVPNVRSAVVQPSHGTTPAGIAIALVVIVGVLGGGGYWLIREAAHHQVTQAAAMPTPSRTVSEPPITVAAAPPIVEPRSLAETPATVATSSMPVESIRPSTVDVAIAPPEPTRIPTSPAATPSRPMDDLVDMSQEPVAPGKEGLVNAMRAGQLRLASDRDLQEWIARSGQPASVQKMRFMAGSGVYVVAGDFTIPDGLYGADSAVFLLPGGVPYPRGNPGHSIVLDMSSGACAGTTCGMLRD